MLDLVLLVAVEAQAHLPRSIQLKRSIDRPTGHANSFHGFDGPVTGLAFNAGQHVALVREVNKIRQIMNFDPRYGFLVVPIVHQFAYLRTLGCDLDMTTDAFRDTGYAGGNGTTCLGVAIHARDLVVACMDLVAELDWLFRAGTRKERRIRPLAYDQAKKSHGGDQGGRPEYL
ncbi:MAG: hypothetical protein O7F71_04465 [Gammaproteobacteria bacterium]|nr:hypothetical protein [Gammaproteobacteria bacterium]